MTRTILHVDFNSYFARVEQQKNPYLRNRPVGIIKAEGRGCVIAASAEAKERGVRTGTATSEALSLAPEIVLLPADFESYYDTTKRLVEICRRHTDRLELFSLDEVFMELSGYQLGGRAHEVALKIKRDLKEELGEWLTVSVGIARNKLLAKLASEMEKPDGLLEITDEDQDEYLGKARFDQICGIGRRLERRLRAMGVTQLLQIREIPDKYLRASFGPFWSGELERIAWGRDNSAVTAVEELPLPKSVSRTYTLYQNIFDQKQVLATIRNLVEEVTEKLRQAGMAGRQFGLMVRGRSVSLPPARRAGGINRSGSVLVTRKHFTNDPQEVFGEVKRLYLKMNWRDDVRFLGVWMSLLVEESNLSWSLLEERRRREAILEAQDRVNGKFGHYSLFPASLLRTRIVYPEVNGYLGDERLRQIQRVRGRRLRQAKARGGTRRFRW